MPVHIKICGITSPYDADLAMQAGADYLGLIFVGYSPRSVTVEQAQRIAQAIRGKVPLVGVFSNADSLTIRAVSESIPLDYIQLHGDEPPERWLKAPRPVIGKLVWGQAISGHLKALLHQHLGQQVHAILFEPPKDGEDTLETSLTPPDWDAVGRCLTPHFLAGRLTPDNIEAILDRYQPYGVDVASGIESQPGIKDPEKLALFCQRVRRWEQNG